MNLLKLSPKEHLALKQQIHATKNVRIFKRAQTLIWLAQGTSVTQISRELEVSRQTVYNWLEIYKKQDRMDMSKRLRGSAPPGRPAEKSLKILEKVDELLQESPEKHGYFYTDWTAPLLCEAIQRMQNIGISVKTVRRCIQKLGYVWKRPRYTLSRQSPTWRQEKGGLNEDLKIEKDS